MNFKYSDKVLKDIAIEIASNLRYDGYQRTLVSMLYNFCYQKSKGSGTNSISNQQLPNELRKPNVRKFIRRIVYSSFRYDIWGLYLADT